MKLSKEILRRYVELMHPEMKNIVVTNFNTSSFGDKILVQFKFSIEKNGERSSVDYLSMSTYDAFVIALRDQKINDIL